MFILLLYKHSIMILKMKYFNKSITAYKLSFYFFCLRHWKEKTLTIGTYNNWTAYTSLIEKVRHVL